MFLCWFFLYWGRKINIFIFCGSKIFNRRYLRITALHFLLWHQPTRFFTKIMSQNNRHQIAFIIRIDTHNIFEHMLKRVTTSKRYLFIGFVFILCWIGESGLVKRHVLILGWLSLFGTLLFVTVIFSHFSIFLILILILLARGNIAAWWPTLFQYRYGYRPYFLQLLFWRLPCKHRRSVKRPIICRLKVTMRIVGKRSWWWLMSKGNFGWLIRWRNWGVVRSVIRLIDLFDFVNNR